MTWVWDEKEKEQTIDENGKMGQVHIFEDYVRNLNQSSPQHHVQAIK